MQINGLIIESFVEWPNTFLSDFASDIEIRRDLNELDELSLIRLKGLFELDNRALEIAVVSGVHPVSGISWDTGKETEDHVRFEILIKRNNSIIQKIDEILSKRTEE